jgi:hypothetical protein
MWAASKSSFLRTSMSTPPWFISRTVSEAEMEPKDCVRARNS